MPLGVNFPAHTVYKYPVEPRTFTPRTPCTREGIDILKCTISLPWMVEWHGVKANAQPYVALTSVIPPYPHGRSIAVPRSRHSIRSAIATLEERVRSHAGSPAGMRVLLMDASRGGAACAMAAEAHAAVTGVLSCSHGCLGLVRASPRSHGGARNGGITP